MKKTYQHPAVTVVTLKTDVQLLAGSPGYGDTTDATKGNLSRRRGASWDDDEDY